ncbi:hypothetical protein KEJ35_06405 [Candidatus Bathyarchaeota archaeon]|nr:hypothetical protein [Candidatus Bathyarchaeota archaeon]
MHKWFGITLTLTITFITIQVCGQLGIFTGGSNAYTAISSFDIYTHALGSAALGAFMLTTISLGRYDRSWRVWIPFQVAIIGTIWELVELTVTWLRLLPPQQMWATVENSVQDIFIDFLGVCTVSFLYELSEA